VKREVVKADYAAGAQSGVKDLHKHLVDQQDKPLAELV
jgi:hypothetical protein